MDTEDHGEPSSDIRSSAVDLPPPRQTPALPRMDTGWSWVVMLGALVVFFTSIGFVATTNVYLTVWMEDFEASATTVGLVLSVGSIMRGVMNLVSGPLCVRFGPRLMMMVGGVLMSTGILMCAFSPSIELIIVWNGLVIALGANLAFVASFQALTNYFSRRFAMALGIASAGISLGQLALPPLYTYLIEEYGWRGSMLITAGVNANIVAAGALMRPNHDRRAPCIRDKGEVFENDAEDGTVSMATGGHGDKSEDDFYQLEKVERELDGARKSEITEVKCSSITANGVGPELNDAAREAVHTSDGSNLNESDSTSSCLSRLKHFLLDTYGLRRMVHHRGFNLLLVEQFCYGAGMLSIAYIVPRATTVGVEPETASFLLSLVGAGSLIGRLCNGWLIDKHYVSPEMAFILAMLLFSLSVLLIPLFVSMPPLAVLAGLVGVSSGTCASLILVIDRSVVQPSDGVGAVSVQMLIWGVGYAFGLYISGVIYDLNQSYDFAFYTGGAFLFIAALLMCVLYILKKLKRRRQENLRAVASQAQEPTVEKAAQPLDSLPKLTGHSNRAYAVSESDMESAVVDVACQTNY